MPDLLRLDISLPVMDGFTMLVIVPIDEILQDIQIIALNSREIKGDREEIFPY